MKSEIEQYKIAYSKSIKDSPEERNIFKNKFLLDSLNEDCLGIKRCNIFGDRSLCM